ncbi:ferric reduction oxidase 2-like protein [Cinnamomum micranthum f. kanehirae]|uniref:ferric-chelate reductase (NADH) n=1 Tax=Cinnamomum micranthum f. kanehirae TaxID=337451 RepID=A0A3S3Q8Z3_9MAGN|nr:ferric reduction oxidase 2-like protein [Cinnamomum micranthum f. kanehirae]
MDSGMKGFAASNVKRRYMFTAMELLLGVVFLGWLFMWVMMPTKTYKQTWTVKLRADTNSTYIGPLGANLLTFTFPILFIAVLGCVYLHLRKKFDNYTESNSKAGHLDLWRRPVLVKGPLGIVSGLELAFFSMFIALLIWAISSFLHISFSSINSKTVKDGEHLWAARLNAAGLRLGLVGNIVCAFLFFPVARGSSILPLVGLTSEASIKYHIWLGHIVMALFTAHGLCYIIFWASTNQISQMLAWDKIGVANVPGELALICGLLMWLTSIPRFRRKMFELFYYTHHLYFLFLFFFVLHVGIAFFCYILPGVYLFLVDRCLRFLQSRCKVRLVSARVLPCEAVELTFTKNPGLTFTSPSMVFINVPSISSFQWHPFTVTSNSNMEPDKLSLVIKREGSWSEKLYQVLSSPSSIDRLEVSLEGPYGPTSTHILRHDTLVMVSGGSGITPFISIIRELVYRSTSPSCPLPRILLITVFKNYSDLTMLDLLLPLTGTPSDISRLQFQLEAFVTRDQEPTTLHPQNLLRTIWFKPNPTDAPVSAVLGPNSWLWLGAIISTSFVGFLLLLGILTRFYIYPIDHNTNMIFPYSGRSAFSVLFVCVCIAAMASAAVMWNKKQNAMEGKKIENMEGQSPTTSPGSWFYNADTELESLPHQSLVQATKVHFGARPNLKKMLLECEGSSVGVMVCGPRGMRQEVAAVCSSGLANHLHFESISFGW